jgi:hypothetical protein
MPIRLSCPACDKPMQAPDAAAGKRVKCPNCQAVVAVPAASAAPVAPAAALPPPVPPRAAAPAAPPAPAPAPAGDNPFGFDDDAPAKVAKRPARAARGEEDETPRKKRGRDRDADDEEEDWEGGPPRKGPKGWSAFGAGCGMVKLGLWIEFGAVAYISLLVLFGIMGSRGAFANVGGAIFLPYPLVILAGTALILMGRIKMMNVPRTTGANTVLLGAVLLSVIRALAVVAGALFAVLALAGSGIEGAMYTSRAAFALGIAFLPGAIAELTVIPAMALAGGCIPDENLRRKSGLLTFVTQMVAVAYFVLVFIAYVALDDGPAQPRPGQFGGRPQPSDPRAIIGVIVIVYLLLQLVYTALQTSMYGAGQSATAGTNRPKSKFEDEE